MNSDIGQWERQRRVPETNTFQTPPRQRPQTKTSPIVTRNAIERRSERDTRERPLSSSGQFAVPIRQRRRSSATQSPQAKESPLEAFQRKRKWPPDGFTRDDVMAHKEAEAFVSDGASAFKGYCIDIPNAPPGHHKFYAVMTAEHVGRTDCAEVKHDSFMDMSLSLMGRGRDSKETTFPWQSLEQPSMAWRFGKMPGTCTLNYRISKAGNLENLVPYGSKVQPKKIKMGNILIRLRKLERGLDEDDPSEMYKYLYTTLIDDPDKHRNPHRGMEMQIADLITVLSHSDWIDFSNERNHVVAKFSESKEEATRQQFYHQLLLAVELYHRIHHDDHMDKAKRRLLDSIPPKISWDLALAQRWLDNMAITKSRDSTKQTTFGFELCSKKRQKEGLRTFARLLKWPNLNEIGYVLDEKDPKEEPIEDRSSDSMSWFSGLVLPGPTLPWLLMNTLIDCDRDTGEALHYLTHMIPASGFQYRANTYWSSQCIVGKVLGAARGVNEVAGWIGPCSYSPDIKRTECVRIRQLPSQEPKITAIDVKSMTTRTDPLGPEDAIYPVDDYELIIPDMEDVTDAIRIEKLEFQPIKEQSGNLARGGGASAVLTWDASIKFACGGDSWPMQLRYDVDFITAYPCHQGPHVLFYDYTWKSIKVDDGLVDIHDWGAHNRPVSAGTDIIPAYSPPHTPAQPPPHRRQSSAPSPSASNRTPPALSRNASASHAQSPTSPPALSRNNSEPSATPIRKGAKAPVPSTPTTPNQLPASKQRQPPISASKPATAPNTSGMKTPKALSRASSPVRTPLAKAKPTTGTKPSNAPAKAVKVQAPAKATPQPSSKSTAAQQQPTAVSTRTQTSPTPASRGGPSQPQSAASPPSAALIQSIQPSSASGHLEEVLVIEALGVSDNEVFARAWCAHWGVSAIVANIRQTCVACAVREAYAACISVVIITEGGRRGEVE